MKDQLRLLEELQRHDARIQELDGALKAIPSKLDDMRKDLGKLEELLVREKAQLVEAERMRSEKETQAAADESAYSKAKQKVGQVKNSKEHMASQREVEALRKIVVEGETTMVSLKEAVEQIRQRIEAHEADVARLRKHVEAEDSGARTHLDKLNADLGAARSGREKAAAAVRSEVLKKYNAIRMRRGLAVVPVHSGTCRGCNMNIPPQLFNTLQRGNSIETCPNCHRLIYWDKLLEDPDGKPSDADASAARPREA